MAIKFGTDGWRAIIADGYTFENVKICTQAIVDYLKARELDANGLIIGYDTRFGSEKFAFAVAEVAAGNSVPVMLCNKPAPTPVISYNIVNRECGAGVVVTASHNPSEWNGLKFKPGYGGSASLEIVEELERHISVVETTGEYSTTPLQKAKDNGLVELIDPDPPYLNHIAGLVGLENIRNASLNVVVDSMHGAGAGYIRTLIEGGSTRVFEIRADVNPSFPNMRQPEPIEQNLGPLAKKITEVNGDVGLATDGDADRLGIMDEDGNYISTLHTFSLICHHLLEGLGMQGPIVRSITMTNMIDKLGDLYGVPVLDTPVGFKYLGPVMMEENAIAAGEESGGYAFNNNMPERDGILSGLLLLEMMAVSGKSLSELIELLESKVGHHNYNRIDVKIQNDKKAQIIDRLISSPITSIGNKKILDFDNTDGFKYILDNEGSWLLIRFSGTEPLLRIYAECQNQNYTQNILNSAIDIMGIDAN